MNNIHIDVVEDYIFISTETARAVKLTSTPDIITLKTSAIAFSFFPEGKTININGEIIKSDRINRK